MKNLSLFLLIVFFVSCKSNEKSTSIKSEPDIIKTNIVISENQIQFQIQNISNDTLTIYSPQQITIQRFVNNDWEKVRILNCPCGAPCAKPAEIKELFSGQIHTYSWDKQESWCGKKNEYGIPETIKEFSKSGKYRIMIMYQIKQSEKQIVYQEFEL
jgi:hypothetical protein